MDIFETYRRQRAIALNEFSDVVISAAILTLPTGDPHKLRLTIVDGSLLDVFLSVSGRYAYHWERRLIAANDLYRHDNAPHSRWRFVSTFPKHFHNGSENNVQESYISSDPEAALREMLAFVRSHLLAQV